MPLRGDFAKLHRYVLKVQKLGQPEALQDLSDNLAEEGLSLIEEGFAKEIDPYGSKWPDKVFGDGRQVLVGKSSQLRRGWHRSRLDHKGFRLSPSNTAPYAKYHQGGTGIYGPRKSPIVPVRAKALRFTAQGVTKRGNKTIFRRSVKGCPKRMMVPRKGDLPPAWAKAFQDCAHDWFRSYFKKR